MNRRIQPWEYTLNELKKNKRIVSKYSHSGIYSISIGDQLVYIGKSRNMLCRLAQHIFYTNNLAYTKSHKYRIYALAKLLGYDVRFDVLYYSSTIGCEIDEDIGKKEAELINKYQPCLNYQIPNINDYQHYTVNRKAKSITLMQILGEREKNTLSNCLDIQKESEENG